MTGPVTTEALVEKLARDLAREGGWNDPDAPWTENQVIIARGGAGEPVWRDFVDDARSLLGRETFATLLAAHQQVTTERDARGEVIASLVDELARLRAEGEDTAVVPLEPTVGMQEDGLAALEAAIRTHGKPSLPGFAAAHVYRAMVAARPSTAKEDQADA